jgi:hypothetical protein
MFWELTYQKWRTEKKIDIECQMLKTINFTHFKSHSVLVASQLRIIETLDNY